MLCRGMSAHRLRFVARLVRDAVLPALLGPVHEAIDGREQLVHRFRRDEERRDAEDRKSTRLNSSHSQISYAVFCLKKKKQPTTQHHLTTQLSPRPTLASISAHEAFATTSYLALALPTPTAFSACVYTREQSHSYHT